MGALAFSQLPLFMQQYQHHLSGHVAELKTQIQSMINAASLTGKSLQQYVIKFLKSEDLDFRNQGELMTDMIHRYDNLRAGHNALQESSIYAKPMIFIRHLDWDIAQSTWKSFEVGFSFSMDGLAYAVIGIVFGLSLFWLLSKVLKTIIQPIRAAFKKKVA